MENSIRQPGRTLTTAAALTIGIALVAMVAVLADGTKATINQSVNSSFAGNLIIRNSSGARSAGLPAGDRAPAEIRRRRQLGDGDRVSRGAAIVRAKTRACSRSNRSRSSRPIAWTGMKVPTRCCATSAKPGRS